MSRMHDKPFKYRYFLDNYKDCPPGDYDELDVTAYRWVFEDLTEEKNFMPVLLINPNRINEGIFDSDAAKCNGHGLSFFDTFDHAQIRFNHLAAKLKKAQKYFEHVVGTKVASVKINPENGVDSPSANTGHFTFHEYEYNNFFSQIVEIKSLLP